VQKALGVVREGAVYLHYGLPENRELVISRGSEAERVVLPYQAFHQYLRAFVPYPPRWMLEGFGIYFGKLLYDDTSRELAYEENLSWLDTVKTLGNAASPVESIFLADLPGRGPTRDFQPMAWALVSFFLNSGGNTDYFRTLSEAFMLLLPNISAGDNAQIVYEHLFKWVDVRTLQADFTTYTQSRMTLADLINAGQRAYSVRNFVDAEYYFTEALYQKPATNAAYYYLGIIAYDNGKYDVAEQYYQSALRYGADPGMVYYALGLNAATSGQNDNAVHFLNLAKTASPARFGERVDSIIARIR
jgi:tetratricopeptide (TPR) repeat protein